MALYALGDLHLSEAVNKPMDVFGPEWDHHTQRIQKQWAETVSPSDVVLLPGDISWAMTLDEAAPDLRFIGQLPGQKVMIRGNHDYWWSGISKVRNHLAVGHFAIQNDAIELGGYAVCGTRGWILPTHPKFMAEDRTIFERECMRFRMSLELAKKLGKPIIAMIHYPPCSNAGEPTPFTDLMSEYEVSLCVYGHLHGVAHRYAFEGTLDGVRYQLVSADYLKFRPTLLTPQTLQH